MLDPDQKHSVTFRRITALLLFISCITIQRIALAEDLTAQTAEEYRALGYVQQQQGNLSEALAYYTKATSLGMENAVLLNDMGVLYEEIDRYGRAEQYYLRAIELDQRYLPPYVNLAYLYQRLGKTDQAAKYFKLRYEMGHPMDPWAQRAKDELVRMDPRYGAWAAAIEADSLNRELEVKSHREFVQRVEQSQEHYKKGDGFLKDERYREAIEEYDMALRLSPDNPKIINARKKALLETIKRDVREHSRQALMLLDAGDTLSARFEIQQMLKMIPKEPILIQP